MSNPTVEQTLILTKLLSTGLSKQQILDAFDEIAKREGYKPSSSEECRAPVSTSERVPLSTTEVAVASVPSITTQSSQSTKGVITYDETPELRLFKLKGEAAILDEIRSFVSTYNIRQNMIAEMTRISQGYISRFFRGEGDEMSERAKNLIYLWYLECRSNPQKLQECLGNKNILSESGDLIPIRRERFLFNKVHLEVLEKFFDENPYPDSERKELIAEACNVALERKTGRKLRASDKVTALVVNNWFNNKRKELKAKSKSQLFSSRLSTTWAELSSEDSQDAYSSSQDSDYLLPHSIEFKR
ncbi:homeobox-containing protein 1-like protein [Dinothrombium tinctorium]|uniref:Homeobox-containing protein 1-like protein n=1 Tax=Dinothrombium tinctorium TaxID=1965070 RepID=A0A3S3QVE0_9ACAR|nr:homeobox-containing protein 1-like protein [Dinothrombium tinctorium]RWS14577.1 homeobox-containing protein 1-like protein [Dinothrombium tinctorium]